MRIDRRSMIKGSAALGAVGTISVAPAARAKEPPLVIYDSRIPESVSFAHQLENAPQLVDIAHADRNHWPMLRGALPDGSVVEGLTGWSDWTSIRGELEARGWRNQGDDHTSAPLSGRAHLFRWTMKKRA